MGNSLGDVWPVLIETAECYNGVYKAAPDSAIGIYGKNGRRPEGAEFLHPFGVIADPSDFTGEGVIFEEAFRYHFFVVGAEGVNSDSLSVSSFAGLLDAGQRFEKDF